MLNDIVKSPKYNLAKRYNYLVDDMEDGFNRIINSFFGGNPLAALRSTKGGDIQINVRRSHEKFRIDASVPGVKQEDLKVEVCDSERYVQISGKVSDETSFVGEGDESYYCVRELSRGQFSRTVSLPEDVVGDPDAVLKDGMLSLTWNIDKSLIDDKKIKFIEIKT